MSDYATRQSNESPFVEFQRTPEKSNKDLTRTQKEVVTQSQNPINEILNTSEVLIEEMKEPSFTLKRIDTDSKFGSVDKLNLGERRYWSPGKDRTFSLIC